MNSEEYMNIKKTGCGILMTFILVIIISMAAGSAYAGEKEKTYEANRYGVSAVTGKTYHPDNNIDFFMLSGFIIFDYEKIWGHKAPPQLRFKAEGSIGAAHENKMKLVTSVNMFALRYLDFLQTHTLKPYIEGGIGVIYTDFQVRGQGLRINFNPQMGIGTEIRTRSKNTLFISLRLHHISNGGLNHENRGINSVMGMLGYYF